MLSPFLFNIHFEKINKLALEDFHEGILKICIYRHADGTIIFADNLQGF